MRLGCGFSAAIILGAATLAAAPAAAQSNSNIICGVLGKPAPTIKPIIYPDLFYSRNAKGFACQMWQAFVYLTWPALPGKRGEPDPNAMFGSAQLTVWETYKTAEQVFLPNGDDPGTWAEAARIATLDASVARLVADGRVRHLTVESKVSPEVLSNIARHPSVRADILESIKQAGGGILYDLNGNPVFYEVSMNEDHYNYISRNGLYNANKQIEFAKRSLIVLPAGRSAFGTTGAISIKAAWKILSPAEIRSGRFHTTQALIHGKPPLRTVGLVGMHIFQPLPTASQGAWATFAHVDNAPVRGEPVGGPFNFYDRRCANCAVNDLKENPTQVMQMFPDDPAAKDVTRYMHDEIWRTNPESPWQYYKLVLVQWPQTQSNVAQPTAPLPSGEPSPVTALNPVLETFVQAEHSSCLGCHVDARVAAVGSPAPNFASYYSFMFGRAKAR